MKIEKVDVNFKKAELVDDGTKACYTIPCAGFDLYGVRYDAEAGLFLRMDKKVADEVSSGVGYLNGYTSGGRVRFRTDSANIGISVKYPTLDMMSHMPLTGSAGFVLLEKTEGGFKTVSMFRPNTNELAGYTGSVSVGGGVREYILFFPLYNRVSELKIYLDADAKVYEAEKYRDIPPILYYGASIDQGGCASRPDTSYTAMLSKWNDIDFINLGFSGCCLGEMNMCEYLTKIDCSLFFLAYDGNAPTADFLEKTHYPFYEAYRKERKDVPIVFMSVPCFGNFPESERRRDILRANYLKARASGDSNVYFIDGETLFGQEDREICTVEGVHPNDLGFYRIAKAIERLYDEIGFAQEG